MDQVGAALVAWHWRLVSRSVVTRPHLHLAGQIALLQLGRGLEPLPLVEMHLPSDVVRVTDGVWFIIHAFGVAPRRAGWERILGWQP